MKSRFVCFLSILLCVCAGPAAANWQYPGEYLGDGWYEDDGGRFVMSVRGGASVQRGSIKNEIGSLVSEYYTDPSDGSIISAGYYDTCVKDGKCGGFIYAGADNLAKLPAAKNLSTFSFAAGVSIGWTVPYSPRWRMEIGWDHISESEYNAAPMFNGNLELYGGSAGKITINVQSGGVHSSITTDIVSAMAFYDFFEGIRKPARTFIPYIGLGLGYADSKTVLNLADLYGDLSYSTDLQNYGEPDSFSVLQFYRSEKDNANIAGLLALGGSYGLTDTMFLDFGARLTYIPKVTWALTSKDSTKHRSWYSANNMIFANVMLGVRFEF
jgi:hypothetical protein